MHFEIHVAHLKGTVIELPPHETRRGQVIKKKGGLLNLPSAVGDLAG
jgi:hypothetical protein